MRTTFEYISLSDIKAKQNTAIDKHYPDLYDIISKISSNNEDNLGRLINLHNVTVIPKHYWVFKNGFALLEAMLDGSETFLTGTLNGPFHQYYNRTVVTHLGEPILANILPYDQASAQHIRDNGIIFSMSDDDTNIYHFIYMTISKLLLIDLDDKLCDTPLIFGYHPRNYQIELLKAFGVTQPLAILDVNNRAPFQLQQAFTFSEALLPIVTSPIQSLVHKLYNRFLAHTENLDAPHLPHRFFINRKDKSNTNRTLKNSIEIEEMCNNHGYQSVTMSDLSIAEQIRLFHNAEDIIFEHGAAGSFLLFAKPSIRVVEILSPKNHLTSECVADHYTNICKAKNINYKAVIGAITNITNGDIEFEVSLPALEQVLLSERAYSLNLAT